MKRFRVALFMAGLLSIGLLSGCSTDTSDEKSSSNGSVSEIVETLHDGMGGLRSTHIRISVYRGSIVKSIYSGGIGFSR